MNSRTITKDPNTVTVSPISPTAPPTVNATASPTATVPVGHTNVVWLGAMPSVMGIVAKEFANKSYARAKIICHQFF